MKSLKVLFAMFFGLSIGVYAQNEKPQNYCGYTGIDPWLVEYQKNPTAFKRLNDSVLYVPMTIHLVGTTEGAKHFPANRMFDALCQLNKDFEPSNIQFYLSREFNYINNSAWDEHDFSTGRIMMQVNNVANSINIYVVGSPAGNCGYFSPTGDAVALSRSCTGPYDHTFAHEVGHFLSLPHTFVGWEGQEYDFNQPAPLSLRGRPVEKVDRSNCAEAADGFCDTPTDYLSFRWNCNSRSESSIKQLDPDSVSFHSDGTYFMSYSNDKCMDKFSEEQMAAMQANILTRRQDLLTNTTPPGSLADHPVFENVTPADDEATGLGEVLLRWDPVPGATSYYVEVSLLPAMNIIVARGIVTDPVFLVDELEFVGHQYHWRVRALNAYKFCAAYSGIHTFIYTATTAAQDIKSADDVSVYPNPVKNGHALTVHIRSAVADDITVTLSNATGQVILRQKQPVYQSENRFELSLPPVLAGLYFLTLATEDGKMYRKKLMIE